MLFEKSCGAVVIRKKDNVVETLIIQMLGGHWSFPKGHVENNETEIDWNIDSKKYMIIYNKDNGILIDRIYNLREEN